MSIEDKLTEMQRRGSVAFAEWADYAWKNELLEQKRRVLVHLEEIFEGAETPHSPQHMLERSVSVAAFCMRRLLECRLVTDAFANSNLSIFEIPHRKQPGAVEPFRSQTGGRIHQNYDMTTRDEVSLQPNKVVNRMLHARILATLSGSAYLPNGLLIASDLQLSRSLFHLTPAEFGSLCDSFLNDRVTVFSDQRDPKTGKAISERS